jgi:hypothetical protein
MCCVTSQNLYGEVWLTENVPDFFTPELYLNLLHYFANGYLLCKIDNTKLMTLSQFKICLIKIRDKVPQQLVRAAFRVHVVWKEMSSCCEGTSWKIWTKLIQIKGYDVFELRIKFCSIPLNGFEMGRLKKEDS